MTRDNFEQPLGFEVRHSTPKRGLATARFRAHLGSFRVNLSIVGPETEQSEHRLTLGRREAEDISQAAAYLVKALKEKAF